MHRNIFIAPGCFSGIRCWSEIAYFSMKPVDLICFFQFIMMKAWCWLLWFTFFDSAAEFFLSFSIYLFVFMDLWIRVFILKKGNNDESKGTEFLL